MKPQRALRNARGKPEHQEEALFNKILCALLVKRTKEEPRERQKKRPQRGGGPKTHLLSQFKMFSVVSVVEV
jgi:hypothetical protein